MTDWHPYHEPLRTTLARTVAIALAGAVLAQGWGGLARWPAAVAMMLWPSLGGHWLELWFLNGLRPRLPDGRGPQAAARLAVWFLGGAGLALGMRLTAAALTGSQRMPWPAWWVAGLAFVGIELGVHMGLHLRGRPSFFDGRG
jgi:hypothetical protein